MSKNNMKSEKKCREAIKHFTRCLSYGTPLSLMIKASYHRAKCYMDLEEYDNAYYDWERALKLCVSPQDDKIIAEIYLIRSLALHKQDRQDEGIIDFQKAIKINPNVCNEYLGDL